LRRPALFSNFKRVFYISGAACSSIWGKVKGGRGDREQRASCGRDISAEEAHPSIRPSIEIYTHNFYLFIFVLSPAEEVGSAAAWQQFRFSGFSWAARIEHDQENLCRRSCFDKANYILGLINVITALSSIIELSHAAAAAQ
jgi:hypothetical protein